MTLATVTADNGGELETALEALDMIALKVKLVTADALHGNRRTVAAINAGGGDWCLALKANQLSSCPMQDRASRSSPKTTPQRGRTRPDMVERKAASAR